MVARMAVLLAVSALFIAGCDFRPRPFSALFGADGCRYNDATYAHGSTDCQSGTEYRCDDGQWKGWGAACAENASVAGKGCNLDGSAYSAGSTNCQSGSEYRCDDGAWRNLAVACTGGSDGAARSAPDGRICMYNGTTVAAQSSVCKAGLTFRCDDGEWRNLGTTCQ